MAKKRTGNNGAGAAGAGDSGSVMGYFRELFKQNPRWLGERSNERLVQRWLQDHPGETEMPASVRNALANVKSRLRKQRRGRRRKQEEADAGTPAARPTKPLRGLEALEVQIDECLTLARSIDREGLDDAIRDLRRARNAVVWKIGQ